MDGAVTSFRQLASRAGRMIERWSRRRAEKNRRFKISCHLGVKADNKCCNGK
jgi:hypothetical protein